MEPLAAFQVLALTVAAAIAVEAFRSAGGKRLIFCAAFVVAAAIGVFTKLVAALWPAASWAMTWVGSSPITFLLVFLLWVAFLQKPWRRRGVDLRELEVVGDAESLRKLTLSLSLLVERISENEERQNADRATLSNLGGVIDEVRQNIADLEKRIIAANSLTADNLALRFKNIQLALKAIWHRERMELRRDKIIDAAKALSRPETLHEILNVEAWEKWEAVEELWREDLRKWCELAECYQEGVTDAVFETTEGDYRSKWGIQDSQFPNSDAVYAYKTFAILHRNWGRLVDNVEGQVNLAAYNGQANEIVRK